MSTSNEPAHAVFQVVNEIRELVDVDGFSAGRGLRADPRDLRRAWRCVEDQLQLAEEVIHKPVPNQGLASIWLREVWEKAIQISEGVGHNSSGLSELSVHDNEALFWLVRDGWRCGHIILTLTARQRRELRPLRERELSPLDRLQELASDLQAEGPEGKASGKEVGELILQAVNKLDIANSWLKDASFCKHILKNIDFVPAIAAPPYVRELSAAALFEFVERFRPSNVEHSPSESQEESVAPVIDIDALERIVESFDRNNGKWVRNTKAAELDGLEVSSLGTYRQDGECTADNMFGRDIQGRIWRRSGTVHSHPWYLRRSLRSRE